MKNLKSLIYRLFLFILSLWMISPAVYSQSQQLTSDQLIKMLQKGGYILYVRHGKTNLEERDFFKPTNAKCEQQRNLSPAGIKQTKLIGAKLNQLEITAERVWSSPYCRCKDTANNVFGDYEVRFDLQFSISKNRVESKQLGDRLKQMMLSTPIDGNNYAFVGHSSNLKDGLGVWPKPEGVVVVFKNRGTEIEYLGKILPDYWAKLD